MSRASLDDLERSVRRGFYFGAVLRRSRPQAGSREVRDDLLEAGPVGVGPDVVVHHDDDLGPPLLLRDEERAPLGNPVLERVGAQRRALALGRREVLDRDRDAVERPAILPGRDLLLRFGGLGEGLLVEPRDVSVQERFGPSSVRTGT